MGCLSVCVSVGGEIGSLWIQRELMVESWLLVQYASYCTALEHPPTTAMTEVCVETDTGLLNVTVNGFTTTSVLCTYIYTSV